MTLCRLTRPRSGSNWTEVARLQHSEFQRKGIGSRAIQLAEDIVKEYSESLYIEVAARNRKAIVNRSLQGRGKLVQTDYYKAEKSSI